MAGARFELARVDFAGELEEGPRVPMEVVYIEHSLWAETPNIEQLYRVIAYRLRLGIDIKYEHILGQETWSSWEYNIITNHKNEHNSCISILQ